VAEASPIDGARVREMDEPVVSAEPVQGCAGSRPPRPPEQPPVSVEPSEDELRPEVEIPTNWDLPTLPQKRNWQTSCTARLVHVVMEAKVRKFAMQQQKSAKRMELQAQQTPRDKFWTIVHWMYNVAYDVEWFNPTNEFLDIKDNVGLINPGEKDQFRTLEELQKHWNDTKKRMNYMLEQYDTSGNNMDVTQADSDHERFYKLSGQRHEHGKFGRADSGVWYAFLMACKYPLLQHFVEAVLDRNTRFSGNLLLPDGTPVGASFLNVAGVVANSGSAGNGSSSSSAAASWGAGGSGPGSSTSGASGSTNVSSGWKRKVEQTCDDFRVMFGQLGAEEVQRDGAVSAASTARQGSSKNAPGRSLADNISMMKVLHEQFIGLNGCFSRMEADDPCKGFVQEELDQVQHQILALRREMREQQEFNVQSAVAGVADESRRLNMDP